MVLLLGFNSCKHKSKLDFFKKHFLERTQEGLIIPFCFSDEEPKTDANVFGKRDTWSQCNGPCKQQPNKKRMKITNNNEVLENYNEEICAK